MKTSVKRNENQRDGKVSGSFFSPVTIQPKLTVGQPNDKYEQEADAMAQRVIQRKCADCEEEAVQKKPELQLRNIRDYSEGFVDDEDQMYQSPIQMKGEGTTEYASDDIQRNLENNKGGGTNLPSNTQTEMQSAFGSDFSGVKVHTDSQSVQMNQELNAQAFTHGKDIYFNSGKYDPNSSGGKELLAHELTHVVQQNKI